MSRVVIRIGNTIKDGMLTPAFAVDLEERKLAKERKRARNRARWAAMTPEERREKWERKKSRRLYKADYGVVSLYADGKLSKCGYSLTKDGRGTKAVNNRRREVYDRMSKIKTGWRK